MGSRYVRGSAPGRSDPAPRPTLLWGINRRRCPALSAEVHLNWPAGAKDKTLSDSDRTRRPEKIAGAASRCSQQIWPAGRRGVDQDARDVVQEIVICALLQYYFSTASRFGVMAAPGC